MNDLQNRVALLLGKYRDQTATAQEEDELYELIASNANEAVLKEILLQFQEQDKGDAVIDRSKWERVLQQIVKEGRTDKQIDEEENSNGIVIDRRKGFGWKRIAVAASIIGVLFIAGYWFMNREWKADPSNTAQDQKMNDVKAPEITKAMITLANGERVLLDSITNGTLARQGNVNVTKTDDGQIVYSSETGIVSKEIEYNTMFNPRGSLAVPLTLIDGTIVWLNSESSLRYFTSVGNGERRVEITGECYFEVAPDAARPFIVKDVKRGAEVQVLGTHFNVNTYTDEQAMKVTLLEGSVSVKSKGESGKSEVVIKPGEQAQVSTNIKVVNDVDVEAVMAWKNGLFKMTSADIGTIMRQLARWYDVEVIYEGAIPKGTISGEVPRNLNLSEVLKVYEYSGVKFKIEGRKIVVMK